MTASKKYSFRIDNHKTNEYHSLAFSRSRKNDMNKYDSLEVFVIAYNFRCNFCIFKIYILKNICNRSDTFRKIQRPIIARPVMVEFILNNYKEIIKVMQFSCAFIIKKFKFLVHVGNYKLNKNFCFYCYPT